MTKPPKVNGIKLKRSPPFVESSTRHETRREHLFVVLLMGALAALAVVLAQRPVYAGGVGFAAFMAGYAWNNWMMWEVMYDD